MGVQVTGSAPPDEDLASVPSSLLEAAERADDVLLLRLALVAGSSRAAARELLSALSAELTVVGSTLSEAYDPAAPEVDVLVETDHAPDTVASAVADVSLVDGVVIVDVHAGAEEASEEPAGDDEGLSIYRLDDHLVVTDDFAAVVERFREALDQGWRSVEADVELLDDDVGALADRVEALEEGLAAVRADVESAADEGELASLRYHVEDELPTWVEVQRVFAPAAERVDGEGRHDDMTGVVAEVDEELRRTHALRETGLLGRLRWLLTGTLPAAAGDGDGD